MSARCSCWSFFGKAACPKLLIVFGLLFLCYGGLLTVFSVTGFPERMTTNQLFPYLADKPVSEDGYYMLTVAWKFAQGRGIVYNYGIATTGVQPLNTLLDAVLAWFIQFVGGDKWHLARAILFQGALLQLVFSGLIGGIASKMVEAEHNLKQWAFSLAFVLSLFNFGLFRIFTYGLETGLYLILVACCILYFLHAFNSPSKVKSYQSSIILGILGGLTTLTRLDFGIVFVVFLALAVFRKRIHLRLALVSGVCGAFTISPWFLYVFATTGSLMPSSGFAQLEKAGLSSLVDRILAMSRALVLHSAPWVYSRPDVSLSLAGFVSLSALAAVGLGKEKYRNHIKQIFKGQKWILEWLIALAMLIPVYLFWFFSVYFYHRYTAPVVTMLLPVESSVLAVITNNLSCRIKALLLGLFVIFFFLWAGISLHTGVISNSQAVTAGYIQHQFSPPVKVGAFQSGVIGYFNENVVNLDGKVNHQVLSHLKEHTLNVYLDKEQIEVLIDWPEVIFRHLSPGYINEKWAPCQIEIADSRSVCYIRVKP